MPCKVPYSGPYGSRFFEHTTNRGRASLGRAAVSIGRDGDGAISYYQPTRFRGSHGQ
jgi:hypothetical protein